jgi:hypothetical protein
MSFRVLMEITCRRCIVALMVQISTKKIMNNMTSMQVSEEVA